MTRHQQIINFITEVRESFDASVEVYTCGSCFRFYKILRLVFPDAICYYNSDHVITEIEGLYHDITGQVRKTNHIPLTEYGNRYFARLNRFKYGS